MLSQQPATVCSGRACRPGEGNPSVTHSSNPYTLPPILENYTRTPPHEPDPKAPHYAALVAAGVASAHHHLLIFCAADYDFRELAENWYKAIRRLNLTNALVYALDRPAHEYFVSRGMPSVDGSANLDAWNRTRVQVGTAPPSLHCYRSGQFPPSLPPSLQRHIQRAEAERHTAAAALAAAGLDVLLTETTHVMVKDVTPALHALRGHREAVDLAVVRQQCTGKSPVGCSLCEQSK